VWQWIKCKLRQHNFSANVVFQSDIDKICGYGLSRTCMHCGKKQDMVVYRYGTTAWLDK
jgi:hypothetical protein